ncbi:MAG: aromatic ring-hydroxylating oxygenase subunit alpha [Gemmataceae bacterium]
MFVHQSQLRHLCTPEQYYSAASHRAETESIFLPAWHLVATTNELTKPGDFVSLELLGRPILIRNMDGVLCAFLNVCAHRHARLTDLPCGNSPQLRCQYHGWEYDQRGRTAKIPDAQAFRPFDRENAQLRKLRVATCGQLVFVSFATEGPSLEDFIGPLFPRWNKGFDGDEFRLASAWGQDFPCNWKVVLENSLESYHIPCVHPKTFGDMPLEKKCWHILEPGFTTFRTQIDDTWINRQQNWAARRLGSENSGEYEHHCLHPHMTVARLDIHWIAMVVYPTSPTTCHYRNWTFTLHGKRRGPLAKLLAFGLQRVVTHVAKRVFAEDGAIYSAVQKGLEASPHPGVIGTREERIYVFQKYVTDALANHRADVNGCQDSPCTVESQTGP